MYDSGLTHRDHTCNHSYIQHILFLLHMTIWVKLRLPFLGDWLVQLIMQVMWSSALHNMKIVNFQLLLKWKCNVTLRRWNEMHSDWQSKMQILNKFGENLCSLGRAWASPTLALLHCECACVCIFACLLACLLPCTVNFKLAHLNFNITKIELSRWRDIG